jgi:hypothetical protein
MRFAIVSLTLLAAAPALAAERWVAPETVRACPQHGPGFVQVPGSTTCVKVGGRVVAETTLGARRISRDQIAGFGASGRVSLDARTDTPYGPVRGYVRLKAGDGLTRRD